MLKSCGKSTTKAIKFYKQCLERDCFPLELKKANVVPVHKKLETVTKKLSNNTSLPAYGKVLKRLLYNSALEFFMQNGFLTPNHSGFIIGDLRINQLVSIAHEIYKSFDDGCKVKGVFLDISKAYDKILLHTK